MDSAFIKSNETRGTVVSWRCHERIKVNSPLINQIKPKSPVFRDVLVPSDHNDFHSDEEQLLISTRYEPAVTAGWNRRPSVKAPAAVVGGIVRLPLGSSFAAARYVFASPSIALSGGDHPYTFARDNTGSTTETSRVDLHGKSSPSHASMRAAWRR